VFIVVSNDLMGRERDASSLKLAMCDEHLLVRGPGIVVAVLEHANLLNLQGRKSALSETVHAKISDHRKCASTWAAGSKVWGEPFVGRVLAFDQLAPAVRDQ